MRAVIAEPGKEARIEEIENELQALQEIVGGYIEVVHPFRAPVCLIVNEEGKLMGLAPNRAMTDEAGRTVDTLRGTVIVAGVAVGGEDFRSLDEEEARWYKLLMDAKMVR